MPLENNFFTSQGTILMESLTGSHFVDVFYLFMAEVTRIYHQVLQSF